MLRIVVAASIALLLSGLGYAQGIEISGVSTLYQSEKVKQDGSNAGGETNITIGGRAHQFATEDQQWFGEARIALTSWDAPSGSKAPSNATSIWLLGGFRQFFTEFSQVVIPYAQLYGGYKSQKTGQVSTPEAIETEESGLYYYGALGFRFDVSSSMFIELESTLFESALFGTRTEKKNDGSKTETSSTDLFVSTAGVANAQLMIALGAEI